MARTFSVGRIAADYTVACICPMGVELAPVEAMLDEIHDHVPILRRQNAYTLGRLGDHNVVVAVMPEVGNNAAAAVAAQLLNDFPAVRFSLLVGIGGGVPGKIDVRLGDVVVGQPTETSGGVIQYDMGKKLEGGGFQRIGMLNKPPAALSAHVRKLDAVHRRTGNTLAQHVSNMMTKYPKMQTAYSYPGIGQDVLFLATYVHQSESARDTCDTCDKQQTVKRAVRHSNEPQIHYGTIGTANTVVKDARLRDNLLKEGNLLCVEMEAAGLMDSFPCLVIRGICDYADSHKNKKWQPYAAAVAAAYMRELLLIIPAEQIAQTECAVEIDKSPFKLGLHLELASVIQSDLFIGRSSELEAIKNILQPQNRQQEQRWVILGGIGGMGKTQLAIAYAKVHCKTYDSIFWLNATSEAELKQSLRFMAQNTMHVDKYEALNDEQIPLHISRWLSDIQNTGWLLIFDNYDEPKSFDIRKYCPHNAHGTVIVTSRLPHEIAGQQLLLQPLQDVEHSIEILETRSHRRNIKLDPFAYSLAKRMQGFPLALATAGAYLRFSPWTCERYLKEYEARWNINPKRPMQLQDYRDRTLYTTWDLSYQRLVEEDAEAAHLLKLLAYFDNQQIWYELLSASTSDKTPKWLHGIVGSDIDFNDVMKTLTDYCLVELQQSTGSWSMHNCVHDWNFGRLSMSIDSECYWYAVDCIAALIHGGDPVKLRHMKYAPLVPHAARLAHERFEGINKGMSEARFENATKVADLLREQWQFVPAETMYRRVLSGQEELFGTDDISTLDTMNRIGNLHEKQEMLDEAEQMYKRALVGSEKTLGPDDTSTLVTIGNLANLYETQGRPDKAKKMYKRALAGFESAFGPDHYLTLSMVNNLGTYYVGQGKLDKAEKMLRRALAGMEIVHGLDHAATIDARSNLTTAIEMQGKTDEAEQMYERTLAGYDAVLGPDHIETLYIANNFGLLYEAQGKLDKAEQMFKRSIVGKERTVGPNHVSTIDTLDNLGALYYDHGRLNEAEPIHRRVLAYREKVLGPDHTLTLTSIARLGALTSRQGHMDEAEELMLQVVARKSKLFGSDHGETLVAVESLNQVRTKRAALEDQGEQTDRHQTPSQVEEQPNTSQIQLPLRQSHLGTEQP